MLKLAGTLDKGLNITKFLMRNLLTNIVYNVVMNYLTKNNVPKTAPLLGFLGLIVAGIKTEMDI